MRKEVKAMKKENLIDFDDEQLEKILAFQKQEGFKTVQEAIMVAVNTFLKD